MRLMYDSTNPADIPPGAMCAGYIDGVNPWPAGTPMDVRIARDSRTDDGHAADIETGAMPVAFFPSWAQRRLRVLPAVSPYVNRANGRLVEDECLAAGFTPAGGQILLWISTLDGTRVVTHWNDGSPVRFPVVAVQFAGQNSGSGGHYDISEVADYWPGVDMNLSPSALFGLGHLIVSTLYHRPATADEVNALGLKPDLSNLDAVVQAVENNVVNPAAAVFPLQATTLRRDLDALPKPGLPTTPLKATIQFE